MLVAVFEWIIEASFYSSIVGIILLLTRWCMKGKISPIWQYALWMILLIKLMVPFGPESELSFFNLLGVQDKVVQKEVVLTNNAIPDLVLQTEQYDQHRVEREETTKNLEPLNAPILSIGREQIDNLKHSKEQLMRITATVIWLIGTVGIGIVLLISAICFKRKLQLIQEEKNDYIQGIKEKCKREMNVQKNLSIIVQEDIGSPALIGVLHPKILLSRTSLELDEESIRYILFHEMAHYKRYDHWINGLLIILGTLHWFNPILLYCFKCIRQDMELCADAKVMSLLNHEESKRYGKALLNVLEFTQTKSFRIGGLTMASDKKSFQSRIWHITRQSWFKQYKKPIMGIGIVSLVILSICLLTSMQSELGVYEQTIRQKVDEYWACKTPYIGNASKVNQLISMGPYSSSKSHIELMTQEAPYGVKVVYDWGQIDVPPVKGQMSLYSNSIMLFTLVDNVEWVNYIFEKEGEEPYSLSFNRSEMEERWGYDLRVFAKSKEQLEQLIRQLEMDFVLAPELKTSQMDQYLGMRLYSSITRLGSVLSLKTEHGSFIADTTYKGYKQGEGIILDSEGKWVNKGKTFETVPYTSVYWHPQEADGTLWQGDSNTIQIIVKTQEGKYIGETKLNLYYDQDEGSYKADNNIRFDSDLIQAAITPDIERGSFAGEVLSIEEVKNREEVYKVEIEGNGRTWVNLNKETIALYEVEIGDIIQIDLISKDVYQEVENIIHFNKNQGHNFEDIGIYYATLKGLEPLAKDIEMPFGEYVLKVKNIYGDTSRITCDVEVDGIDEALFKEKYLSLHLKSEGDNIGGLSTHTGADRRKLKVEFSSNNHSWEEALTFKATLGMGVKEITTQTVEIPLEGIQLYKPKYYEGDATSYTGTGTITLQGIWIEPTSMALELKGNMKGRVFRGLYHPTLFGNQESIYNQSPSTSASFDNESVTQYIIPSAYFDNQQLLQVQAEGYTYTLENLEPITLSLKDTYPKYVSVGEQLLGIEKFYYDNGMLHIVFMKNQPIDYLGEVMLDGERVSVGATSTGEAEDLEYIYIIHTGYKEQYDITLDINWIQEEKIAMAIDLK